MPAMPIAACDATTVTLSDGRVLLSFGGCNYLGLANHPAVIATIGQAACRYGLSSSASRETTGNSLAHEALERELAEFLGVERTLLVPDGYLANIAACQGLAGVVTHAVLDAKAHVSLRDGAQTAGLEIVTFDHRDPGSLRSVLRRIRPARAAVMTDGVFTAYGAPAPIAEYAAELGPHDWLVVDDCHGLGVVGPGGRGSVAREGVRHPRLIITSSLAKGLGCAGGMVSGPREAIARSLRTTGYVCTTPIAPALAEGTRASLSVLRAEPWRTERLAANGERLRARLHDLGLCPPPSAPHTPIVAFTTGDLTAMERLAAAMLGEGFRVPFIAYPGGPAESYFRITVNAEHTPLHIDAVAAAFARCLEADDAGLPRIAAQPLVATRAR